MSYSEQANDIAREVQEILDRRDHLSNLNEKLQLAQIYATLALKEELEKRVKVNWV